MKWILILWAHASSVPGAIAMPLPQAFDSYSECMEAGAFVVANEKPPETAEWRAYTCQHGRYVAKKP